MIARNLSVFAVLAIILSSTISCSRPVAVSSSEMEIEPKTSSAPVLEEAMEPMEMRDSSASFKAYAPASGKTVSPMPKPKTKIVIPEGVGHRRLPKSGLRAGFADDNKQYNYFLNFLKKFSHADHYPMDVSERIILKIKDLNGRSYPDAEVEISADGKVLESGKSYADGSFLFFPSLYPGIDTFKATISAGQYKESIILERDRKRLVEVQLQNNFSSQEIPVDLLFIFDTTGSMGEEIQRLKKTIELIHLNLSNVSAGSTVSLILGLVLYKDREDQYNTKLVPLTSDLQHFQQELSRVTASGGGDTPENLQAALEKAMMSISWREKGVKAAFIITDAPPHLDYGQTYTYLDAAKDAKEKGIKLFSVGTGGLNINGEIVLRQLSQYTSANYLFLTYGEQGESEGGRPGSVSHHTGDNFQTDKLEALVIKLMKKEINNYAGRVSMEEDEFFQAKKLEEEKGKDTLEKLFARAGSQLVDYSSRQLTKKIPLAVLPLRAKNEIGESTLEYFSNELMLAFSKIDSFSLVERKDAQLIENEIDFQLSDSIVGKRIKDLGEKTGAEILLLGEIYQKSGSYELFLKLIDVKTAEILSLTKSLIDKELGL